MYGLQGVVMEENRLKAEHGIVPDSLILSRKPLPPELLRTTRATFVLGGWIGVSVNTSRSDEQPRRLSEAAGIPPAQQYCLSQRLPLRY